MDRSTRIELVASVVWLIFSSYFVGWLARPPEGSLEVIDMTEPFVFLCAMPLVIYWVYRACFGVVSGLIVSALFWLYLIPMALGHLEEGSLLFGLYEVIGFSPFPIVVAVPCAYWAYRFIKAGKPSKVSQPE